MALLNIQVERCLWRHWTEQHSADAVALISPSNSYSWQELDHIINQYAVLLRQQGISPGDVVTVIGKNSELSVVIFLAALSLGAAVAFVAPQTEAQLQQKFDTLYKPEQTVNLICLYEGIDCARLKQNRASFRVLHTDFKEYYRSDSDRAWEFNKDSVASLVFTSGSTGTPKAVAHSSRQHLHSADGLLQVFHFSYPDCWLLSLPLYHVSGLSIIYRWLLSGATLKIGTGTLSDDIQGVTHASLVATQLQRLLDSGIELSLTHVLLGGSDIPTTLSSQAAQLGIETWVGYGMTEAASTVTAKRVDGKSGVGQVLPHRKVLLHGNRIWIGGKTLASGYYRQGTLTSLTNDDNWFDSKDLGQWENSELVIQGRVDNQFISGGENVHCEEIETALIKHPDILQVLVIPIEDKEFGARPVALVKVADEIDKVEYEQWLRDKLEKFKWPVAYFPLSDSLAGTGIKLSRPAAKQWLQENYPQYTVTL